jgi:uncharacterized protein
MSTASDQNPRHLDVAEFARQDGQLAGLTPLAELERLAQSQYSSPTESRAATLDWQLRGELRHSSGAAPTVWLHLQARAQIHLQCQRCLQAAPFDVVVNRSVRFVANEDEAAEQDLDSEEDVEVLTPSLDAMNWLEDELLLALPLVPRHESCPQPLATPTEADEPLVNPFAVLAQLKSKTPGKVH